MKKAIWFSRHQPTAAQIADASRMGYDLTITPEGIALGSMDIQKNGDIKALVSGLLGHCTATGAVAIFGVFPAPLQGQIARTADDIRHRGECIPAEDDNGDYPCFSAWNVMRTVEGGKPTFEHRSWVGIGRLSQASCRWLGANLSPPQRCEPNQIRK